MQFKSINLICSAILLIVSVKSIPVIETIKNATIDNIFPTEECKTKECYEVSKRVLASLDDSVNPCEDFYQFTCGGWIKNHPLQYGQDEISGYLLTSKNNIEMLRKILKGKYKPNKKYTTKEIKYDKEIFTKIKNIYNTCLNIDAINNKGNKPMLNLLHELKIYENRKSYASVKGFTDLIITLHNRSVPIFFDISNIIVDSDLYQFSISENGSNIKKEEFSFFDTKYRKYTYDTLNLIFKNTKNRNITAMTDTLVNFEYELFKIHYESNNKQQMTIKELSERYHYIDWKTYIKKVFKLHKINEKVTNDTIIYNSSPEYFSALNEVISKFTNKELAYYAEWSVIRSFINYLSDDIKKPHVDFELEYFGRKPREMTRIDFCDEKIDNMMGMPLGKFFADIVYTDKVKEDANYTISYLKQAMVNRIPQLDWLDEEAQDEAIEKVLNIVDRIGLPEYLSDPKQLSEKYESLKTSSSDFFTNMINYDFYSLNKNMKLYKTKYEDETWFFTPQSLNAYYDLTDNSMNFPVGIFQDPNYHAADPDYMNYGSIGMVVGHELSHAFDMYGRIFDANLNFRDWWSMESYAKFDELSQCFVDQYSEFYVTDESNSEIFVDGYETLNENLADNGGVARAFEAWKISVENDMEIDPQLVKEHNPLLPGLSKYSFEQLFYIAFGQEWCSNASTKYIINQVKKDEHSPSKFRVNGVVMNSEHFAKVFDCPVNSPMNPKKKCTLW
ncbi:hypothetical protein PIROE2DRAFT_12878 [Piromyces sp. E2]|nr:hypothetical protein PIROE2DRAFT_12878 [Piromyces sp. E2]|eukprot:OUM61163.1 hypothetical protein PIROE2DRAFT_12878 [Piromyces sp. E2]